MDLTTKIRREMVRSLVAKAITCPRTKDVLDFRTCVVLLDRDGDPAAVMSQSGWREITRSASTLSTLADMGLTVDKATVSDDLCLASFGGYGACVMFPKHRSKHRDANGCEFEVTS